MRTKNLFGMTLLAIGMVGCQSMEDEVVSNGYQTVGATMEIAPSGKVAVEYDGTLSWSTGDKIGIYTTANNWVGYTLVGEGGGSQGAFTGYIPNGGAAKEVAVYPYNEKHTTSTFEMPEEYPGDKANVAMMAAIENPKDLSNLSFKHLGGAIRINVKNMPTDAYKIVFTAKKQKITGTFSINENAETGFKYIELADQEGGSSAFINFGTSEQSRDLTFIFPMPIGTFKGFTVTLERGSGTMTLFDTDVEKTLSRAEIANLPLVEFIQVGGNLEGGTLSGSWNEEYTAYTKEELDKLIDNDSKTLSINDAEGLVRFAQTVNEGISNFEGVTVYLTKDIDLAGKLWTPIGHAEGTQACFNGTFDAKPDPEKPNNIIKNLTVNNTSEDPNCASGLFGWVEDQAEAIIRNVTIMNANIKGHHYVGAIAGYITGKVTIENCSVYDAKLSCTYANSDASGDKCGAVLGQIGSTGCKVDNIVVNGATIDAGRDAGEVIGAAVKDIQNCVGQNISAENVTVTANGTGTGLNIRNEIIGRIN